MCYEYAKFVVNTPTCVHYWFSPCSGGGHFNFYNDNNLYGSNGNTKSAQIQRHPNYILMEIHFEYVMQKDVNLAHQQ